MNIERRNFFKFKIYSYKRYINQVFIIQLQHQKHYCDFTKEVFIKFFYIYSKQIWVVCLFTRFDYFFYVLTYLL